MRNRFESPSASNEEDKDRVPPPTWPFHGLHDEGRGPTHNVGGGDTYDITKGPDDLRNAGKNIVEEEEHGEALTTITPEDGSEDIMGALPKEDDAAARWLREMEEKQKKDN